METIKNVFSSNTEKNEEATHGSGREFGTTVHSGAGGITGEGSHLAQAHNTTVGNSSGLADNQAAGAEEGSHIAQDRNTNTATTSGLSGNQTSGITGASNSSPHNPVARDAAVAASGVGLADHEHRKHDNERGLDSATSGQGIGSTQGTGYSSTPANDLPIAASMGASGLTGTGQGASHHTGPTGTSVQGPHSTTTANRLDPAVNTSGTTRLENAHEHSEKHGGGGSAADKHHTDNNPSGGQISDKHHLGREAAIGGGIGAAAYEADNHHRKNNVKDLNTLTDPSHPATTTSTTATTTAGPQSSSIADKADSSLDNTRSKDHHYGRDAALGVGAGAGTAGLAEHEHSKRASEYHPRDNVPANSGTTPAGQSSTKDANLLPGPAPNTAGPHKKDWMNKLDPFVDSHPSSKATDADILAIPARSGQGSYSEQTIDQDGRRLPRSDAREKFAGGASSGPTSNIGHSGVGSDVLRDQKSHHLGRDAVVAGAVGGTAYEAEKHHRKNETEPDTLASTSHTGIGQSSSSPTTGTTTTGATYPPFHTSNDQEHGKDAAVAGGFGGTTTTSTGDKYPAVHTSDDHHYGRDAAVVGGVGGAAYEAEKHHRKNESNEPSSLSNPPRSSTIGQSTTVTGTSATGSQPSSAEDKTSKDHHYGRDAAVAGGVGGATYEAEKHHKHDKDFTQAEKDAKKEHKHEVNEAKKEHKYEVKEEKKEHKHEAKEEKKEHKESKGGLLGFLHRDKSKKYTPEEEAEFDRQEREHTSSSKKTAAAEAGAGSGAAAMYASDKQHYAGQTPTTNTLSSTTPGNSSTGTAGTSSGQHHGREAALGAGAVGAAAVAEHEHNKSHSGPTPLAEKPKGRDLGDILHGVERNRGVPGSSGYPGTEGFGTGIGGALAAKEVGQSGRSEATTDQSGAPLPLDSNLGSAGQHQKTDSGYATVGHNYQTGQHDHKTSGSGLTGSNPIDHSSAVPRSTGLDTDNKYRKQDTTSGMMGSNTHSGLTGSNNPITGASESGDGRNRLHKDPPAGHPASQAGSSHVPGSKDNRETLLNEGEKAIDKDTGVANSHATAGTNAATNY